MEKVNILGWFVYTFLHKTFWYLFKLILQKEINVFFDQLQWDMQESVVWCAPFIKNSHLMTTQENPTFYDPQ